MSHHNHLPFPFHMWLGVQALDSMEKAGWVMLIEASVQYPLHYLLSWPFPQNDMIHDLHLCFVFHSTCLTA